MGHRLEAASRARACAETRKEKEKAKERNVPDVAAEDAREILLNGTPIALTRVQELAETANGVNGKR